MKTMAKKDSGLLISSASVVDGKLILSLPDAATPVVWQMDLEQAKSSALEVREDTKTGRFALALKTQKGETVDIASYEEKTSAVQALMVTSRALENAHGKIRPAAANSQDAAPGAPRYAAQGGFAPAQPQNSSKASAILAVLLIVFLFMAWAFTIPKASDTIARNRSAATGAPTTDTGVPVSADDFLSNRQ